MRLRTAIESGLISVLLFLLMFMPACTFYGEHPARSFSEATGGEGLERVFWKNVQAANWVEVERALASNYAGVAPGGALDRSDGTFNGAAGSQPLPSAPQHMMTVWQQQKAGWVAIAHGVSQQISQQ